MGKSMKLGNLTQEEAQQILKVIQKDFELRQKERERLGKLEEVVEEEENKTQLLTRQQQFNDTCCIRCCRPFGLLFNRKQKCLACKLFVCKACSTYDDNKKGYTCNACLQEIELKNKSLDWFYDNVSKKYKRFGSAKVVRTLYKHSDGSRNRKYHMSDVGDDIVEEEYELEDESDQPSLLHQQADNESDSGYDPSLYSSFGQSGSSVRAQKSRPSLKGVFPNLSINEDSDTEITNNLLCPPPLLAPVLSDEQTRSSNGHLAVSPPATNGHHESMSTQTGTLVGSPGLATTPTQTSDDMDTSLNSQPETRDIYEEAFEKTKRTEEAKFKVRFDNLMSDMQQAFERLSPRDGRHPPGYSNTSYGDLMTTYKGRIKDMLVSLSQRLELAVESFDASCANNPSLTCQKVRQMMSRLVEDRLGESLDLTSDEAVSDLSSLSDDSTEHKSLEDQIAQAIIAKVLEIHRSQNGIHLDLEEPHCRDDRRGSSESEVRTVVRSRNSSVSSEPNVIDNVPKENRLSQSTKSNRKHSSDNKSGSKHRKSDINANVSRTSVTSEHDDVFDSDNQEEEIGDQEDDDEIERRETMDIDHDDSRSGEDVPDSRPVPPKRTKKVAKQLYKSENNRAGSPVGNKSDVDSGENANEFDENEEEKDEDGYEGRIVAENGQSVKSGKVQRVRARSVDEEEDVVLLKQEFEKLRSFASEIVPKPLFEEAKLQEEIVYPDPEIDEEYIDAEPVNEEFEPESYDHETQHDEFSTRFLTYGKVHEDRQLPDWDDYDECELGFSEVDPDLLSMNLAPIAEETEEELLEEDEEEEGEDGATGDSDWRHNWMFKGAGGINTYETLTSSTKPAHDFGEGIVRVPKPNVSCLAPIIGGRDVDEMSSDLSDEEERDLSDEENSFYARTSEEIARITRKTPASIRSGESDVESVSSRPQSSSFSDSGVHGNRLDESSESRSRLSLKLSEELVPAENDDPKFEIPPISVTVAEGEPAKLTCRISGTTPVDVFWYRVHGEDLTELENSENFEIVKEDTRHYLTMYNMTHSDAGQYMCMAINENGRCCQYFILTTKRNTMEQKAPEFLRSLADVEVMEGQSVKFRCKVKGYPQPRVVWYKDGQLLTNKLNCKLERFGNRDYILAIDVATMDEDAEYCALAKNIAGEARSCAQLIVEPKDKPENVSVSKSTKDASSKVQKDSKPEKKKDEFPDLSYLRLNRSRASKNNTTQSSSQSSPSSSLLSSSRVSESGSQDDSNLTGLGEKLAETRESVTSMAEDMLSSSKELCDITRSIAAMDKILEDLECDVYSTSTNTSDLDIDPPCDLEPSADLLTSLVSMETIEYANDYIVLKESAENLRKVTSTALDSLDTTDAAVSMRTKPLGGMATSTPRSSDTERVFNPDSDTSHIPCDSDDVAVDTPSNTSEDSHKSEISFNFNPMNIKAGSSAKSSKPVKGKRPPLISSSSEEKASSDKETTLQIDTNNCLELSDNLQSPRSPNDSMDHNTSTDSSERLRVNLGPKKENKEPYRRDFYVTDTPVMSRRTPPTSPRSPPMSPHIVPSSPRIPPVEQHRSEDKEKQRAHTEEQIYVAAGTVHHLGNQVQKLEDKMRALNALQEQDKLQALEGKVAQTKAQVVTSELQVKDIERSLSKLVPQEPKKSAPAPPKQPGDKKPAPASNKTKPAPARPVSPVPRPEPTLMKGFTSENDLPESRTEFNEDYGSLELPSVNRLKAMFGASQVGDQSKDSSIKRGKDDARPEPIHSITARSVSKNQLEKLRSEESSSVPAQSGTAPAAKSTSAPPQPGRASSLQSGGQAIRTTPNGPKQVYQSSNQQHQHQPQPSPRTHLPTQSIQVASNVKKADTTDSGSHKNVLKLSLATGNTNRPVSPETTAKQSTKPAARNIGSTSVGASANTSHGTQVNNVINDTKTGHEIDTPEERKSPKIKHGAISAMSKFWEKVNEGKKDSQAPDILEKD